MKPIDIEYIQERIFQSRPSNQFVISEFELALLFRMEVQRLHAKLLAATECFDSFQEMTDGEFDMQKRVLRYSKDLKKNKYCYVFTEEQVAKMQTLFARHEYAYKIIPTITLSFESLTIPYEKRIKEVIREKRKAESNLWRCIAAACFIVYFLLCLVLHPYIEQKLSWTYIVVSALGLIIPGLSIILPREKIRGWYNLELVDKEYQFFYQNLINQ